MQIQTAVSAYFTSKQILPSGFTEQNDTVEWQSEASLL